MKDSLSSTHPQSQERKKKHSNCPSKPQTKWQNFEIIEINFPVVMYFYVDIIIYGVLKIGRIPSSGRFMPF